MRASFMKVFVIYALFVCVTLVALTSLVTANIQDNQLNRARLSSADRLLEAEAYFEARRRTVLNCAQNAYYLSPIRSRISDFFEMDRDSVSQASQYFVNQQNLYSFMDNMLSMDSQMSSLTIYKLLDDTCYIKYRSRQQAVPSQQYAGRAMLSMTERPDADITFFAAEPSQAPNATGMSYMTAINLKSMNTFKITGLIMAEFPCAEFEQKMRRREEVHDERLIVTLSDGSVVYDFANQLYGKRLDMAQLDGANENGQRMLFEGGECLVSMRRNDMLGLNYISVLPFHQLLQSTRRLTSTIFEITIAALALLGIGTYWVVRTFRQRTRGILRAMDNAYKGDLSTRAKVGKNGDELAQIAEGYNTLIERLELYISRVFRAELDQKNAQMLALQAQINPHFLYNTLEAIYVKAKASGAHDVMEMVIIMSKLFREATKGGMITTIQDELEGAQLYLRLCGYRYGNKLNASFDISDDALGCATVRHSLQPLIENYIVHGLDTSDTAGWIHISAVHEDGFVIITVKDNGLGMPPEQLAQLQRTLNEAINLMDGASERKSIGIANVHNRIRLLMGAPCGLRIESAEAEGTTVTMTLKFQTVEELIACITY